MMQVVDFLMTASRNLLSRCLRAKPAAYSATAGTPQAWLCLVGREGPLEPGTEAATWDADEEVAAAPGSWPLGSRAT